MKRITSGLCALMLIISFTLSLTGTCSAADISAKAFQGASEWAVPELEKASHYGFLTDRIKTNLKLPITREEFAELIIRVYERYSNKIPDANTQDIKFSDTKNMSALKAAYMGFINATDPKKKIFSPLQHITREQINGMFVRMVAKMKPIGNFSITAMNQLGLMKIDNGTIPPNSITTREQAVLLALRVFEKVIHAEQSSNKQLPEGFPIYVPVTADMKMSGHFKGVSAGQLYVLLSTSLDAQRLWDFYSNINNYSQFDNFTASFDNKTGSCSMEVSLRGLYTMNILLLESTDDRMYVAASIQAVEGKESYIDGLPDQVEDLQVPDTGEGFFDFIFSPENRALKGLNIGSSYTKPNRSGYKGKILSGFPADIPIAANTNEMSILEKENLQGEQFIKYKYYLKNNETDSLKFFINSHNYSNVNSFEMKYSQNWGFRSLTVYTNSKAGVWASQSCVYESAGSRGYAIVGHCTAEDKLYLQLSGY